MIKDGFGYRQADLYLDDDEFVEFRNDLAHLVSKYIKNEPNGRRRRRTLANILIPGSISKQDRE